MGRRKVCERRDEKCHLIVYTAPRGLVTYFGVILTEAWTAPLTLHQSAACNRVEIGCILSKDYNLSSAVCACNSCHILRGPEVKQADLRYVNETSITVRPRQDKEENSLLAVRRE